MQSCGVITLRSRPGAVPRLAGVVFLQLGIVAAFQANFIFNGYSDLAIINYSPLKIRCFFGFAAMPRRGVGASFGQKSQANSKLPASTPIQSNSPLSTPKQCFLIDNNDRLSTG
jgi:hypothetical protein